MGRATATLDMTASEKQAMLTEVNKLHASGKITDEAFDYLKSVLK